MMSALDRYLEFTADEPEADPIERLRFFLSLSLSGQDWIDVEQFIDAVTSEREQLAAKAGEVMRERCQKHVSKAKSQWHAEQMIRAIPGVTLWDLK